MSSSEFLKQWGVDESLESRGGLFSDKNLTSSPVCQITLLQRSKGKLGARLGKTTGWIHRSTLKAEGLLTRDPRMVERKKPGQKKARKKFQFSKR